MGIRRGSRAVRAALRGRRSTASAQPDSGTGHGEPPVREPEPEHAPAEVAEPGWRASSYDLKHGLDVVELPTSLPADVLDRLFDALAK